MRLVYKSVGTVKAYTRYILSLTHGLGHICCFVSDDLRLVPNFHDSIMRLDGMDLLLFLALVCLCYSIMCVLSPLDSAVVQIISPQQDKYIKRTPDGTPMEVALTHGLRHPNIVHALRHASFSSQVPFTCKTHALIGRVFANAPQDFS